MQMESYSRKELLLKFSEFVVNRMERAGIDTRRITKLRNDVSDYFDNRQKEDILLEKMWNTEGTNATTTN